MSSFTGIDYSTRKVAISVLQPGMDPIVLSYQAPKKVVGIEATMWMMSTFVSWCTETMVLDSKVFIESPIMGRILNAQTAVGMGIAAGALMQASIMYGASSVDFVAPSYWKKRVTGNGGYAKAQISEWLGRHHPDLAALCKNDDEVDAMCMAIMAQQTAEVEF